MKQAARWTAIAALFIIPFLPLYIASDLFFPFITGKNFAFRILVEIALAAYVLLALLDRKYRPRFSWIMAALVALVAWMAVANLLGVHPHKAFWSNFERMDGWVTLVHLLGFFLVAGAVFSVDALWRKWWLTFVGVAALVACGSFLEIGGTENIRLAGSLGNPIYLAVYQMFAIFAAAWLALESRGWLRYALYAFIPFAFVTLFLTGSRGPLVGFGAGVGFGALLWLVLAVRGQKDRVVRRGIWIASAALIAVLLAAGTLFLVRDSAFVQGNPMLSRAASVFSLEKELAVRGTIWGMALEGAKDEPITGYGQEGFNQVFNEYYRPSLYEQEPWFDRVHNMYLDWLIAGGIPAFLLFIVLVVLAAYAVLRAPSMTRAERVLVLAALAAYAVQALVVFDNLFSYVPLIAIIAMAHGAVGREVGAVQTLPELRGETQVGIAAGAALVVACVVVWLVNVPGIRAANHLVYALSLSSAGADRNLMLFREALSDGSFASQEIREQLVSFAGRTSRRNDIPGQTRAELIALAVTEMEKEVARSPYDARLRSQYSSALGLIGDAERSLEELDKAIALSPRKQALHISRGLKLAEAERFEEAHAAFRTAYELDPSFDSLAVQAAAGYILSGDSEGGKALLTEAVGTTTPDNETLFYAYYQAKHWNELVAVARARVTATGGTPESRLRLAQALAAAGRFMEARDEIASTIVAFPSARAEGEALLKQLEAAR